MEIKLLDILKRTSCAERVRVDKLSGNKTVTVCEGFRGRDFSMDELCKYNTEVIAIEVDRRHCRTLFILVEEEPK